MIGKIRCWLRRMRGGTHIWKQYGLDKNPNFGGGLICQDCDTLFKPEKKRKPLIERIMNRLGYIRTCKIIRPRGVFIRGCREWTKKGKG
jgi:hypothetical protein